MEKQCPNWTKEQRKFVSIVTIDIVNYHYLLSHDWFGILDILILSNIGHIQQCIIARRSAATK